MNSEQSPVISDQYLDAMVAFVEAVKRSQKFKKRERIERTLRMSLQKAFREQGRVFLKMLAKFKNRFAEAAQVKWEVGSGKREEKRGGYASSFGDDVFELDESIPPTEWLFVFYETTKKTFGLFEKPIDAAVQTALWQGAASMIADGGMNIRFDLKNPRAVKYLNQYGAQQVTKINDTTRDFLQTILKQSADEGWSYDRTAEAISERFNEFAIGKPQAHIDSRAHLIAVTETGNAILEGQMIVARDLQDAGVEMEKAWSTVGDGKVSDGCRTNEADGWIALDKPFSSGHMRPLRFPGCRCDLMTRMKK